MELQSAGLSVDFKGHEIDLGVVELDPGHVLAIGAEPDCTGVGDNFFLVDPIAHAVEDGAGNA